VSLAENVGHIDEMRAAVQEAIAEFTEIGDRWGLASCLMARALINTGDGDLDEAFANYERARSLVRELGAHDDEAWLHLRLADIHARRGDLAAAEESVECALALSEGSGSQREVVFGHALLADLRRREGNAAESRRLLADVLERVEARPPRHPLQGHGLAVTLAIAARHALLDGDVHGARSQLDRAFATAIATRDMPIVAAVGVVVAWLAAETRRPVEAAEVLGAAALLRGTADATACDIAELSTRLRAELGADGFTEAYERGRALNPQDARDRLDPSYVRRR
jgi:tetratricopeptide (TPR) repeat protein